MTLIGFIMDYTITIVCKGNRSECARKLSMDYAAILTQDEGAFFMLSQMLDLIRSKLYATGRIRPCIQNDIRLDTLFGALLICKPRYEAEYNDEVETVMLSMISRFKAYV